MKKLFLSLLCGVMVLGITTGCGDKGKTEGENNSGNSNEKYGVTKTIYYEDKYSVDIKFPKEYYDYKPEITDTASFSGSGLIRMEKYKKVETELQNLQQQLDWKADSEEYSLCFEKVKKATINNMEVNYIYFKEVEHGYYHIRADIYIKPDVKYYINYITDDDEANNDKEAYDILEKLVKSIGKIKEL